MTQQPSDRPQPSKVFAPTAAPTPRIRRENPFATIVVVAISVIIGSSMWIAVNGLIERARLLHGLQQILDIEYAAHTTYLDNRLDNKKSEDLLLTLERLGHITTTGNIDAVKTLTNPWGGTVTAATIPGGSMHIDTSVPAYLCRRVIDQYDEKLRETGLLQIEVRDAMKTWLPVYAGPQRTKVGSEKLALACSDPHQADIVLTFSMR